MSDKQDKKNLKSHSSIVLSTAMLAAVFSGDSLAAESAVKTSVAASTAKSSSVKSKTATKSVSSIKTLKTLIKTKLTSPLTKQTMTYQDLVTKKNLVEVDIELLTTHIVENIEAGIYEIETVAQGMDYLDMTTFNMMTDAGGGESYGPTTTGGTGGQCSDSEGSNCGENCGGGKRSGSYCGSGCEGSAGNNCGTNCKNGTGFVGELAANAFIVNFNEEMYGYDSYMLNLVNCYKSTILQNVMSQL